MLDLALRFLSDELNAFLLNRALSSGEVGNVALGPLVDDSGKWATAADKIGMTLINVEEERTLRAQLPDNTRLGSSMRVLQPDLKLNLTVLFHARPSNVSQNYEQSLRFLSNVLTFFQSHPVFTPERHPGLDVRIEKLMVELLTLGTEQLNQMWAYLGAKYLPSVVYRVRMLVVQGKDVQAIAKPIMELQLGVEAS